MNELMKQMSYGLTIDEIANGSNGKSGGTRKLWRCFDCGVVKKVTRCGGYACPLQGVVTLSGVMFKVIVTLDSHDQKVFTSGLGGWEEN